MNGSRVRSDARLVALTASVGCYQPHYVEGLRCTTGGDCPPGQTCSLLDDRCYATHAGDDAGRFLDATVVDAPVDVMQTDAMADAGCVASGTELRFGPDEL